MADRYERNHATISHDEQTLLAQKKVAVIGCGGLGGYVIECLTRIGVGHLTVIDGDVFEVSNLNRQLLATKDSLGSYKAEAAKARMLLVNDQVQVSAHVLRLDENNGPDILKDHDVIVDAVDSIKTRLMLETLAHNLKIPLVHGAIAGWYGQVTVSFPGDYSLHHIYKNKEAKGAEAVLGNPSFTPALIASYEVAQVIKVLIGRGELLRHQLLFIDTYTQDNTLIPIG